jgi:sialate O-acetylesterase
LLAITLSASWNPATVSATADASGNWIATIPAAAFNTVPQSITVTTAGYKAVMLTNILIGDVWLCSGQSNMAMPLDSISPFTGVLNYKQEIAAASYPSIRIFDVTEDNEFSPITKLSFPASWAVCSPATAGTESAVAYYFAQKLNTTLNIPIGIIVSAVNGSYCQDWANAGAITSDPVLSANYLSGSSGYYNGMISPLTRLALKGFTWYQGENNEHDTPPSNYSRLNSALIHGWRTQFGQSDLPFYYVQLTPFAEDYNTTKPAGGDTTSDYLALFREAQANIRTSVYGAAMAVTMDVGEVKNHHPRNKKPVGDRLALLALNYTYGQNVPCIGPQYASFSLNQRSVTVRFKTGTADGLNTINNAPLNQHFFVAGPDKVFHWAPANISGNTIVITAPVGVPLPIQAVRYAFTNAPITNLQNAAGLPAEPFRTDQWNE